MLFIKKYHFYKNKKRNIIILSAIYLLILGYFYFFNPFYKPSDVSSNELSELKEKVIPESGFELVFNWNNLGKKMIDKGVIDADKFVKIYQSRGGFSDEMKDLLYNENNGQIIINQNNAGFWLNLFWGLGLANKNTILETGPMAQNGNPANFASTGGWTIASDNTMDHFSKHEFIKLTSDQQKLVEEVSKNIYRPCCNNPTYFPDCNHGMAMLGLLELMASQDASESEMYRTALKVNSYWFPTTYITIVKYIENQGKDFEKMNPKEILGKEYSSSSGFQKIQNEVYIPEINSGSCSI